MKRNQPTKPAYAENFGGARRRRVMERMEGSRVKEMIEAKREDTARLAEQVSKLQNQINENNDDINTLQNRCLHKWSKWNMKSEFDGDCRVFAIHTRVCGNCGKKESKKGKVIEYVGQ